MLTLEIDSDLCVNSLTGDADDVLIATDVISEARKGEKAKRRHEKFFVDAAREGIPLFPGSYSRGVADGSRKDSPARRSAAKRSSLNAG